MNNSSPGYPGTQDDVLGARIFALIIDHFASLILGALIGVALATFLDSVIGIYVGMFVGVLAYFVLLEVLFAQTVGKRITGVAVINEDGGKITIRQSLIRNLLRVIDGMFGYLLGLAIMLLSENFQRVGDHVADTVVVRARQ